MNRLLTDVGRNQKAEERKKMKRLGRIKEVGVDKVSDKSYKTSDKKS